MPAPTKVARPRLTVAILARDAEHLLIDTLDTAAQLADEVIVCDTGSTDGTCELARQHGAKVIERAWNNSFAEARNAAWEAATGEWILWLDAGERIAASDARALRSFVDSQADPSRAYLMLVVVPPAPDTILGEQAARIRLVPNRSDLRYAGRVRETLKPALARAGMASEGLPWPIARSAVDSQPEIRFSKAVRNLKLLELEGRQAGQTAELLVAKGEALMVTGDLAGANACFRLALHGSGHGSSLQREAYYGLLAVLDTSLDHRPQQVGVSVRWAATCRPMGGSTWPHGPTGPHLNTGRSIQKSGTFPISLRLPPHAWRSPSNCRTTMKVPNERWKRASRGFRRQFACDAS